MTTIIIGLSSFISLILLVWFNSDAIIEWGGLLGLSKFLMVDEFYSMRTSEETIGINYPTFLKIKYNNIIFSMLACPLCLSIWLSILICCSASTLISMLFVLSPIVCMFSLIEYGIITTLLKL